MHVRLTSGGIVSGVGPTMAAIRDDAPLSGQAFTEVFQIERPRGLIDMAQLLAVAGQPMRLRFREPGSPAFKAVLMPDGQGGAVVNLSFGISLVEAVQTYKLTSSDFAPTDLSIELLYLIEAKSAAMDASRTLNRRLQVARVTAEAQAFTDTLTGLKNRRALDQTMAQLTEAKSPYALMHLDLDYFKQVNDSFGHAAGDAVLQEAARRMLRVTRQQDTLARVGGDEFIFVFEAEQDRNTLADIAKRLIEALEAPILFQSQTCHISASAGIVLVAEGNDAAPEQVVDQADGALYAAKQAGRAQFCFAG